MSKSLPSDEPVEQVLAQAARWIDEGVERKERIDAFDAYQAYEEEDREASPCFAKAQDLLLRIDEHDRSGRSHALRGAWYTRVESQNVRVVVSQTARAWTLALAGEQADAKWQRLAAYALLRDGRGAEAVRILGRLLRVEPEAHLYYLRALGHERVAKLNYARRDLERAIDLDGHDWRFFAALADTYQEGTAARADALRRAQRLRADGAHGSIVPFGDEQMLAAVKPERVRLDRELGYLADWYEKLGRRIVV